MSRPIQLPLRILALALNLIAAGAIGGGACAAIDLLIRGRQQ